LFARPETAYLDIQQYPDVFQSGLRQILEEICQPGHRLVWLIESPQFTQEVVVAGDELLVPSKASLEVLVLRKLSIRNRD
jgi:hypothetical protein